MDWGEGVTCLRIEEKVSVIWASKPLSRPEKCGRTAGCPDAHLRLMIRPVRPVGWWLLVLLLCSLSVYSCTGASVE